MLFLSSCFLLFGGSFVHGASESDLKAQKAEISKGIKKYEINIGRLEKGIEEQEGHIEVTRQQERDLLEELEDIDTRLYDQKKKLR